MVDIKGKGKMDQHAIDLAFELRGGAADEGEGEGQAEVEVGAQEGQDHHHNSINLDNDQSQRPHVSPIPEATQEEEESIKADHFTNSVPDSIPHPPQEAQQPTQPQPSPPPTRDLTPPPAQPTHDVPEVPQLDIPRADPVTIADGPPDLSLLDTPTFDFPDGFDSTHDIESAELDFDLEGALATAEPSDDPIPPELSLDLDPLADPAFLNLDSTTAAVTADSAEPFLSTSAPDVDLEIDDLGEQAVPAEAAPPPLEVAPAADEGESMQVDAGVGLSILDQPSPKPPQDDADVDMSAEVIDEPVPADGEVAETVPEEVANLLSGEVAPPVGLEDATEVERAEAGALAAAEDAAIMVKAGPGIAQREEASKGIVDGASDSVTEKVPDATAAQAPRELNDIPEEAVAIASPTPAIAPLADILLDAPEAPAVAATSITNEVTAAVEVAAPQPTLPLAPPTTVIADTAASPAALSVESVLSRPQPFNAASTTSVTKRSPSAPPGTLTLPAGIQGMAPNEIRKRFAAFRIAAVLGLNGELIKWVVTLDWINHVEAVRTLLLT